MTEAEIVEVLLLFTATRARIFASNLARLQRAYGTHDVVATLERAIDEALERV